MKNNYRNGFGALLVIILLANITFAQSNAIAASGVKNPGGPITITAEVTNPTTKPVTADRISIKVARSFLKNFQDAENVYWSEGIGGYNAEFNFNGRQVLAYFTKTGMLDCVSYYGFSKHLPSAYKQMLESNYREYLITATAEIKCNSGEAWIVTLQNCNNMRKIKITEGLLEETEHLRLQ